MARNYQMGGCEPLEPPKGTAFQPIRAMVTELVELSPEDYRGVWVTLKANLTTSVSTATIQYRVPTTHNLIIERITAHLVFTDFGSETEALGNIGSSALTGVIDFNSRLTIKAMNVKVTLSNSDRNQALFDNGSASLLSLMKNPIDWTQKPHIVPAGELLDGTVSLVDSDSAIVGASTEYGVAIIGSLIRVKRS